MSIYPRRQLGPDAIKALRDVSLQMTGDRFSYDDCRVQKDRYGNPSMTASPEHMRWIGKDDPDSYGHLISKVIIPKAERAATAIKGLNPPEQRAEIQRLLRRADKFDRQIWWLLSASCMRRILLPASFNREGRRIDGVRYLSRAKDFHNCRVVGLPDLSECNRRRFKEYALKMTDHQINPEHVSPLQ